jgi:hypothetical protein
MLGATGIFPPPTRAMYQTDAAFAFSQMLMGGYIVYAISFTFLLALIALWTRREALAALLILPVMANIMGFHAFLDGGLLTSGAILGNVLCALNLYLLWKNRAQYASILGRTK